MKRPLTRTDGQLADMWARHTADWRDTAQVSSQWREAANLDSRLLQTRVTKGWWSTLEQLGITLFVTREYEHLVLAFSVVNGRPKTTFFPMPHPSGLTVDRHTRKVYVASTRNPNQVYTFRPLSSLLERSDVKPAADPSSPALMPATSAYYPGSLYIHDLAMIGNQLHANAVGHNAVVRLQDGNCFERVWWPKCIEVDGTPVFGRNHIQLNSIAAGSTLAASFFSASSDRIGRLRPGHLNYPVDRQGVIFSGATREPVCTGLTRPHSARLRPTDANPEIWVDNSGYGEIGFVQDGRLEVVRKLPGWTRGLCMLEDVAFVGTSRIIPKFSRYAPGLDASTSVCGVHAISCKTGGLLGSVEWPYGNQIFSIDWITSSVSTGFIFQVPYRKHKRETVLFYSYLNQ
jgi:uncharacterized protein (TIGR03032 family)